MWTLLPVKEIIYFFKIKSIQILAQTCFSDWACTLARSLFCVCKQEHQNAYLRWVREPEEILCGGAWERRGYDKVPGLLCVALSLAVGQS